MQGANLDACFQISIFKLGENGTMSFVEDLEQQRFGSCLYCSCIEKLFYQSQQCFVTMEWWSAHSLRSLKGSILVLPIHNIMGNPKKKQPKQDKGHTPALIFYPCGLFINIDMWLVRKKDCSMCYFWTTLAWKIFNVDHDQLWQTMMTALFMHEQWSWNISWTLMIMRHIHGHTFNMKYVKHTYCRSRNVSEV